MTPFGDNDRVIVISAHLADEVKAGVSIIGLNPATQDEALQKFEA